ncbi:Uncharacterised protein [Bordetella pertussis]|nr:Uncharacterised protein [Bordetella pertussis]
MWSWRGGATPCTARTTSSYCCGPVTASTLGCTCRMTDSSTPMQPVTMTLPFSAIASPIASSDSALALSMKPQVLTTTTSASLYSGVTS